MVACRGPSDSRRPLETVQTRRRRNENLMIDSGSCKVGRPERAASGTWLGFEIAHAASDSCFVADDETHALSHSVDRCGLRLRRLAWREGFPNQG